MEHELLKKYKNELGYRNLILKYVNWKPFYAILGGFLLITIITFIVKSIWQFSNYYLYGLVIVFFIFYFWSIFLLNKEYKRVIEEKYEIISTGKLWNRQDYLEYRFNKFRFFFYEQLSGEKNQEIQDIDYSNFIKKITYLLENIEERIKDLKAPYLVHKGIVAALFAPIWIQMVSWVYAQAESYLMFGSTTIIMLTIASMLFLIYYAFKGVIYDTFINSDYEWFKALEEDIKRLYFEIL